MVTVLAMGVLLMTDIEIMESLKSWWEELHPTRFTFFLGIHDEPIETKTYITNGGRVLVGAITSESYLQQEPIQGVCCAHTLVVLTKKSGQKRHIIDQAGSLTTAPTSLVLKIGIAY